MGTSHFRSDVRGDLGTETIRGFATISASTLTGATGTFTGNISAVGGTFTGNVSAVNVTMTGHATVPAAQYIRLGDKLIFGGTLDTEASIVAVATAITATPTGSLYLCDDGKLWMFDAANTATRMSPYV